MTRRQNARRFVEVLTAALVVALLFGAVPRASADDNYRATCRNRIEKAEFKLEKAVHQHGLYSHQAEQRRRQLRTERERCWNRERSWWDGRSQSWQNDRDWDRDDFRDHDHDNH